MTTLDNECDADALTYSCVCENNVSPNITQYSQTLPFYICQAWGTQCVAGCGNGANTCADKCRYVSHGITLPLIQQLTLSSQCRPSLWCSEPIPRQHLHPHHVDRQRNPLGHKQALRHWRRRRSGQRLPQPGRRGCRHLCSQRRHDHGRSMWERVPRLRRLFVIAPPTFPDLVFFKSSFPCIASGTYTSYSPFSSSFQTRYPLRGFSLFSS